jgi:DNA-binding CsgD family transcriptional regulator/tetratricopeptide (TPR) repeat protein
MSDQSPLAAPIGREPQRAALREWVAGLAEGRGRAVLIEGEAGIGKSALVRTAMPEAAAAGCQVFWAACDELSQAFPLLPLLQALDSGGDSARGKVAVSGLLRSEPLPGNRIDVIAAAAERLLSVVDELCAAAPVMLVVDDIQWADPATVMTVGRLVRAVRKVPLLIVATGRPVPKRDDVVALRRALDPGSIVQLRSFTAEEAAELVGTLAGGEPGPRLLKLAEGAAGNPLYLTELVEALARGGVLDAAGGVIEATRDETPGSLSAAITDRLEFLSPAAREVVRIAALLGLDFAVSELAVVSGRRLTDLLPILDEAILAGVVLENGAELTFRHPLIRASLYEGMPTAVRSAWHRDAARALMDDGAPPERVARQLLPAVERGDADGAVDKWVFSWLAETGPQLVGQAPRVAIPLLRWAMSGIPAGVSPHADLACRLADALYRVGEPDAAAEVATAALGHATRPDLLVDLHWTLTQCRASDGRSEESLRALNQALETPGIQPRHRARLLVLAARAYRALGRLERATQVAERALDAAKASSDRWAMGWALLILTILYSTRGESTKALPLYDEALAVSEGDPALTDLHLLLQINQAVTLGDLDRYDDAIIAAEQVRRLAGETGNVLRLTQAQSALGELLFDVGRWDDALSEIDLALGVSKDPAVECTQHSVAATIRLHRGDAAVSERHLADADRFADRLGDRIVAAQTLARSLQHEQAESPAEALAVLMEALSDSVEETEEMADLLADAVRLAVAVGDESVAHILVQRAELMAATSAVPHRRAVAPHCRGLLQNDPDRLLKAAEGYRVASRPLPRAQALEAAAIALAERGDVAAARVHFTDAYALYAKLGAEWDLARTQARFRSYGIRRGPRVRHRQARRGWDSLTPSETRVAAMVAQGMSNPQIAAQLFLSRRTVQTHVSHILAKLELQSRIDIAREASQREATHVVE